MLRFDLAALVGELVEVSNVRLVFGFLRSKSALAPRTRMNLLTEMPKRFEFSSTSLIVHGIQLKHDARRRMARRRPPDKRTSRGMLQTIAIATKQVERTPSTIFFSSTISMSTESAQSSL